MEKYTSGNWNELPWQFFREGMQRKVFSGKQATMMVSEFKNGHDTNPHRHPYEQIAMILEGECDYYVNGVKHHLTPGGFVVVPPDVEHYIHVYESSVPVINLDVFTPYRDEYVKNYQNFLDESAAK